MGWLILIALLIGAILGLIQWVQQNYLLAINGMFVVLFCLYAVWILILVLSGSLKVFMRLRFFRMVSALMIASFIAMCVDQFILIPNNFYGSADATAREKYGRKRGEQFEGLVAMQSEIETLYGELMAFKHRLGPCHVSRLEAEPMDITDKRDRYNQLVKSYNAGRTDFLEKGSEAPPGATGDISGVYYQTIDRAIVCD